MRRYKPPGDEEILKNGHIVDESHACHWRRLDLKFNYRVVTQLSQTAENMSKGITHAGHTIGLSQSNLMREEWGEEHSEKTESATPQSN
eukprot:693084-Amphidinium_carterae.2